ncbi:RidA family protein [Arthrobacter frigidicola]|nr:RidA family protein [Arthrobacter frigidicola]
MGEESGRAAGLLHALTGGGADFSHLIRTTVFVASSDRKDLTEVWNVVRARMGDQDVPSTLLGVAVLGYPEQLVEVEAIAALPAQDSLAPAH